MDYSYWCEHQKRLADRINSATNNKGYPMISISTHDHQTAPPPQKTGGKTLRTTKAQTPIKPEQRLRGRPGVGGVKRQMNAAEFREWVKEMDYPLRSTPFKKDAIPYDIDAICDDLGIRATRLYSMWRGEENGVRVDVSATVTELCMSILARRRAERVMSYIAEQSPGMAPALGLIADALASSSGPFPSADEVWSVDVPLQQAAAEAVAEASKLREQAIKLRKDALFARTAVRRKDLRLEASRLVAEADAIEEKARDRLALGRFVPSSIDTETDDDLSGWDLITP